MIAFTFPCKWFPTDLFVFRFFPLHSIQSHPILTSETQSTIFHWQMETIDYTSKSLQAMNAPAIRKRNLSAHIKCLLFLFSADKTARPPQKTRKKNTKQIKREKKNQNDDWQRKSEQTRQTFKRSACGEFLPLEQSFGWHKLLCSSASPVLASQCALSAIDFSSF